MLYNTESLVAQKLVRVSLTSFWGKTKIELRVYDKGTQSWLGQTVLVWPNVCPASEQSPPVLGSWMFGHPTLDCRSVLLSCACLVPLPQVAPEGIMALSWA